MFDSKKGFSLAEILISLGIMSVIATIGFTLTKQSIERAYDMYIYTGYKGIYDAILDANSHGLYISDNGQGNNNFYGHINNLLAGVLDLNENRIETPNNITYTIDYHGQNVGRPHYGITMTIPSKRTRNGGDTLSTCLAYFPENNYAILLLPASPAACQLNDGIDLRERIDLLPFYIDNGLTGRSIPGSGFTPREYYSAREAMCHTIRAIIPFRTGNANDIVGVYDCLNNNNNSMITGAIKPAHPRKIR